MTEYIYFELNGIQYRTDGVIVEGKDGSTWNRTNSLRVVLAARDVFKELYHGILEAKEAL